MTDIDITQDLGGLNDGYLGDAVPQNGQSVDTSQAQTNGAVLHGAQPSQPLTQTVDPLAPPAKDKTPSLHDQLTSAFKDTAGKPVEQADAASAAPEAPKVALTKDADGRYRQPDGTFASQEQITAFEAAAQQPPAQQAAQPEQNPAWFAALTPLEQTQFKSLPAETQQYIARTMEDTAAARSRFGEYELIESQLIGPRRAAWAQNGQNPAMALNQLIQLSEFAGSNPQDFVLWFADQNKIDLDKLLDDRYAASQQANTNPELAAVQQQLTGVTNMVQQLVQAPQQAEHQNRVNAVQAFMEEKDGSGSPKRPYLNEVGDGWYAQISAIRATNPHMPDAQVMQLAYDNACQLNPSVRAKLQTAAEQEQAARARNAASSVSGAPSGTTGSPLPNQNSNLSLHEQLAAQFAAARA